MLQNCSRTGAKSNTESLTKTVVLFFFRACGAAAPIPIWKRSPLIDSLPGCHRCDLDSPSRLCSSDPVRIVLVQILSTRGMLGHVVPTLDDADDRAKADSDLNVLRCR